MKIIQWILIALIFLSPYKANASRDSDSYDGNIFPIYAGNGAIVPPQTTLQESLKNKRVAVVFSNPYIEQPSEIDQKYNRLKPSQYFNYGGISHYSCSS